MGRERVHDVLGRSGIVFTLTNVKNASLASLFCEIPEKSGVCFFEPISTSVTDLAT